MSFAIVPVGLAVLCGLVLVGLAVLRILDRRAEAREWRRLAGLQPFAPAHFSAALVADIPEQARRYFLHAIAPGTPLLPVTQIAMSGQFSLGTQARPDYRPMTARQILAAPDGFVWAMRTRGGMPLSGSDTGRWTRFRIFGLIPVARLGGTRDHARAAFGRFVAEAVIWAPASLLPRPGVRWEATGRDTARVTVGRGELCQSVDVRLDAVGRPVEVHFERWSDANSERQYRLQPFGAVMSDFRDVEGYCLPFHVEAGNMFGTPAYYPFFLADVEEIRFPSP
jgi:hypothetical protein